MTQKENGLKLCFILFMCKGDPNCCFIVCVLNNVFGIQITADYFVSLLNNLETQLSLHSVNISPEISVTSGKIRRNNVAIREDTSIILGKNSKKTFF